MTLDALTFYKFYAKALAIEVRRNKALDIIRACDVASTQLSHDIGISEGAYTFDEATLSITPQEQA